MVTSRGVIRQHPGEVVDERAELVDIGKPRLHRRGSALADEVVFAPQERLDDIAVARRAKSFFRDEMMDYKGRTHLCLIRDGADAGPLETVTSEELHRRVADPGLGREVFRSG